MSAPNPTSGETATFKKSFLPAVVLLKQSSQAIGTALREASSQTAAQILTTFRGLASRWQSQLGQLQMLRPPSNLAGGFNTLTSAGKRVESDLNVIVAAVAAHDKTAGGQAVRSVVIDILAARSADSMLEQKLGSK